MEAVNNSSTSARRRPPSSGGWLAIALGIAGVAGMLCGCKPEATLPEQPPKQIITVFAPEEMEPFIRAAEGAARTQELGWAIDLQTGGAQSLAWTIETGDVPDLYISSTIEMAEELIPRPTRIVPWLHDRLVVATLKDNPDPILHSPRALERSDGRVAVGGDGTQQGEFARLAMRYAEIWPLVERRTTQRTTADHMIESLRAGEVEAAILFASDAAKAGDDLDTPQVLELPEAVRIIYCKASFSDLGAQFADFLDNPASAEQAALAGYVPHADTDPQAD